MLKMFFFTFYTEDWAGQLKFANNLKQYHCCKSEKKQRKQVKIRLPM